VEKSKEKEDVECLVIENFLEIGKIVIESKKTEKWAEFYVGQLSVRAITLKGLWLAKMKKLASYQVLPVS
jgi:di/tripeptidase